MKIPSRAILLITWVIFTLYFSRFHEPWRDEAQAWLVVRSSSTLFELLRNASAEGTGPVYYLILWPFARSFPQLFPGAIFWISWTGTLLAACLVCFSTLIPVGVSAAVLFGFFFGYEYSSLARLYGWGCFFLLGGILADLRGRNRTASLLLSLACLTQLCLLIPAIGWLVHRCQKSEPRQWKLWLPVIVAAAIALAHLKMGSAMRGFELPLVRRLSSAKLGNTLAAPFFQWSRINSLGIWVFASAMALLNKESRKSFLITMVPYLVVFLFLYNGESQIRHGGPFFLLWLVFYFVGESYRTHWKQIGLAALLAISVGSTQRALRIEIGQNFSDGSAIAAKISETEKNRPGPPKIFAQSSMAGFVVAARLNSALCDTKGKIGAPFFSPGETANLDCTSPSCPDSDGTYYVGSAAPPESFAKAGKWQPTYEKTDTVVADESLSLFRFKCEEKTVFP